MIQFAYSVMDRDGRRRSGTLEAADRGEAMRRLESQELTILRLLAVSSPRVEPASTSHSATLGPDVLSGRRRVVVVVGLVGMGLCWWVMSSLGSRPAQPNPVSLETPVSTQVELSGRLEGPPDAQLVAHFLSPAQNLPLPARSDSGGVYSARLTVLGHPRQVEVSAEANHYQAGLVRAEIVEGRAVLPVLVLKPLPPAYDPTSYRYPEAVPAEQD